MPAPASAITPASFQTFGELLRYLRKRAELSQRELALHVGYHYSYMSRIENNEHRPDPALLMARFVPALRLEKDPIWTHRLLELATVDAKDVPSPDTSTILETRSDLDSIDFDPLAGFPVSLTPLLGRQGEITELEQLLSRRDVRLITLIGPPGVGKTRLAVQAATEAAGSFAHGLEFIDLAPIHDASNFLPTLVQHLDVNEIPEVPLIARLAQALRQKNILLVLDNFEQLVDAAPQVYQLLSTTPHVKMLVTSRVPLHIIGENQFTVHPLALPQDDTSQNLLEFAAIRLFVERARAVKPGFQLTPENTDIVVEICHRLDGLPLAIELAAARVRMLSPAVMLKEFEHRFDWLAPNLSEEQAAKQTLRGAIEWSYNLLSAKERILFRRLSVFAGGRTVETAKAVCAELEISDDPFLSESEIFDLLIRLTDHSLLFTETIHEEPRFHFLETIHEFAREKLTQSGEEVAMKNRHLAYFCQIAERVELEVEYENQTTWLNRCETEHNNMRAALDWALQKEADLQMGIRLAASLGLFWYLHNHFIEGLERSKVFLQKARMQRDEKVLAKLLFRTADLHLHQAEFETAVQLGGEAMALCRKIDAKQLLAWALYVQGDIFLALHDLKAAEDALVESVNVCIEIGYEAVQDISLLLLSTILLRQGELARAHGTVLDGLALAEKLSDPWAVASGLQILGEIFLEQKNYSEARRYFKRSLEASRGVGDKIIVGGALVNLASLTNLQGEFEMSDHYAEEALGIFQLIGDETQQPFPLRLMGYAAIHAGNLVRARVLMRESLSIHTRLQDLRGQLACLVGLAQSALAEGNVQKAVILCALANKAKEESSFKLPDPDEAALEAVLKQCELKLEKAGYDSFYAQGESLNLEDVLQERMNR